MPLFQGRSFDAFLFDMDGTILTSIIAAERVWSEWAARHGVDVDALLATMHGVRTIETIRRQNLPGIDAEAEAEWITQRELVDLDGIDEIPGARLFLSSLPPDKWAIVTSAPRILAERRIAAAGLPTPRILIAAEDVTQGKPNPAPFLLGAHKLGVAPDACTVFEDAPAGITAGHAAGASVVVITHTHRHVVTGGDAQVPHYADLSARETSDGRLELLRKG